MTPIQKQTVLDFLSNEVGLARYRAADPRRAYASRQRQLVFGDAVVAAVHALRAVEPTRQDSELPSFDPETYHSDDAGEEE